VLLKNEDVIIERAGKPVARLTACRVAGRRAMGKLDFRKARGLGKALWGKVNVPEYIAREREQWD
jgi:antitoxin (DNA-binding transcriptional repressor) of toxin-antitoxin stability system